MLNHEIKSHIPKFLLLVLALATLFVTLSASAVHTPMSRTIQADYHFTEKQAQAAEKSSLSVMLEKASKSKDWKNSGQVISATDQGITVTAVQTLVDKYRAVLVFRVDGFDLPDGAYPSIEGCIISIAGKEYPCPIGARIFNGLVMDVVNGTATYLDGSPLEFDQDGATILRPLASDGSFEFCVDLSFPTEEFSGQGIPALKYLEHLNSEIVVKITNIGIENGLAHIPKAAGDWTLRWTLTGTEESKIVEPHKPIGTSGFTLLNAEITPLGCVVTMEGDAYSRKGRYSGETYYWIPQVAGVVLKDGTFVPRPAYGSGGGGSEASPNTHRESCDLQAAQLDQIQALAFYNMDTEKGFPLYEVPIT